MGKFAARWYLGAIFIGLGGTQLFAHDLTVPNRVLSRKNPVASSDAVLKKARTNYEDQCSVCHGDRGKGDGPMASTFDPKPANLADRKSMAEMTDGEIYWIITQGKQAMPPFDTTLSENERWGLVHLLRNMSGSPPNNAPHNHTR
jgi:mono/diheme cytochrome c family protein